MARFPSALALLHPRRLVAEWGPALPLGLATVFGPLLGVSVLAATSAHWFEPLEAQGAAGIAWIFAATVLLAGLSLMPTHAASLISGMLFGWGGGSLLALVGTLGAALLGHRLLSALVGRRVLEALERRPRAAAVHRALVGRGTVGLAGLVALLRLSTLLPFAATNLVLAAARVPVLPFLAGTALGIAPRVCVVALAGSGLSELDLSRSSDQRLALLGAVATVLVLVVLTRLARRVLKEAA